MLYVYSFLVEDVTSEVTEPLKKSTIARFLGVSEDSLQFARTQNGKPYLKNYPRIHFNLSHTRGHVLLGISDEGEIGVDIEEVSDTPPYEIVNLVFGKEEKEYLDCMPEGKAERFYELWTKKEAYLKYIGTGFLIENPEKQDVLQVPGKFYCFMIDNCQCAVYSEKETILKLI